MKDIPLHLKERMKTTQVSLKEIFWKVADTVILRHECLEYEGPTSSAYLPHWFSGSATIAGGS